MLLALPATLPLLTSVETSAFLSNFSRSRIAKIIPRVTISLIVGGLRAFLFMVILRSSAEKSFSQARIEAE